MKTTKKQKKEKKNKKKNSLKHQAIDPVLNKKFHVNKITDASQKQLDWSCKDHWRQLWSHGTGQQICRKQKVQGQVPDAVQKV